MTASVLPSSPDAFATAAWEDVAPYYDELAERPLTAETAEGWLRDWSRLEELLTEAASLAMIAYTCDTGDLAKEAAHLRFSTEIMPKVEERSVALARRLVESGFERPELRTMLERFRTSIAIFREANVPIFAELEELGARYQRITGAMTVFWEGEERPVPQLAPFLKSPDRAIREHAFHAINEPYLAHQDELAGLFDRMYALRQRAARHAGFANFRDYVFPAKYRFDYTPADVERFHEAVKTVVTPALERVLAHRRTRLDLDILRPWDLQVDPYGTGVLRPFQHGRELGEKALGVFERVDPALGRAFRTMVDERLLDLDSRKGKAPGGYCDTLHHRGRPFIFMNAVGIVDDVNTLLHEAGHAFHTFAAHAQPLIWQRHPGSEAAELASMSMELLAAPHLAQAGGMFSEGDLLRARLEHFEDILSSLSHIASVDAFQTWIYTSGEGGDRAARDAAWLRIRRDFERGVDWTGLDRERVARWYRQLHIFLYPFYYIEYGIAQIGALQVWRNSLTDPAGAVARYREALALGATVPLPEIFRAAGAKLTFDARDIGPLVALVMEHIEQLWARLPGGLQGDEPPPAAPRIPQPD
ncbi:MAG TPA: M3 family oligoendopeptidase [Gemmatimonadales bacterium]|nr:M3 family oligoendopeptidase [Gemmatimonadales bacterium]